MTSTQAKAILDCFDSITNQARDQLMLGANGGVIPASLSALTNQPGGSGGSSVTATWAVSGGALTLVLTAS